MKYKVKFRETTTGIIDVEASSMIAAVEQARIEPFESGFTVLDDKIRVLEISEDDNSDEDEDEEYAELE